MMTFRSSFVMAVRVTGLDGGKDALDVTAMKSPGAEDGSRLTGLSS
jgi:hypothetical protein